MKNLIFIILMLLLSACSKDNVEPAKVIECTAETDVFHKESLEILVKSYEKRTKFIGFSKDMSKVFFSANGNGIVRYFTEDLKSGEEKIIYEKEVENFETIAAEGLFDDNIYFAVITKYDNEKLDNRYLVNYVTIKPDGRVLQSNNPDETTGELLPLQYNIPKIVRNGKNLFAVEGYRKNLDDGFEYNSRLANYNIESGELNYILHGVLTEKDKTSGNIIVSVGSMGNTVYYEIFNNDESKDKAKVYSFDIKNMKDEDKIREKEYKVNSLKTTASPDRERSFEFLSGDEKLLITTDERTRNDSYEIGGFHFIKDSGVESKVIKDINFGNKIVGAFKINENYIVYTNKYFYIYDSKANLINTVNYKADDENYTIINSENYFCTWKNIGNKFKVEIYKFEK